VSVLLAAKVRKSFTPDVLLEVWIVVPGVLLDATSTGAPFVEVERTKTESV
jgi:hypothetical protein